MNSREAIRSLEAAPLGRGVDMTQEFPYNSVDNALESELEKIPSGEITDLGRLESTICERNDADETTKLAIMDSESWGELEAEKISIEVRSHLADRGVLLYPAGFFDSRDETTENRLTLLRAGKLLICRPAPREYLETPMAKDHILGIHFRFTVVLMGFDSIEVRISEGKGISRTRSFSYLNREEDFGPLRRIGTNKTASFLSALNRSGALLWRDYYQATLDGYDWSLAIEFDNGFVKEAHGSNVRPKEWRALMRSLRKVGFISSLAGAYD
jgi:hypothetical protein